MKKILLISLVISQVLSYLKIEQGPDQLMDHYISRQYLIDYTVSPFGEIPFERYMKAELKLADPLDGCTQMKKLYRNDEFLPFVLIQGGNCSYSRKVAMAQLAGAEMAIIYNNSHHHHFKNVSIQHIELVIPSISIPEDDGLLLETYIRQKNRIWLSVFLNRSEIQNSAQIYLDIEDKNNSMRFISILTRQLHKYHFFADSYQINIFYYINQQSIPGQHEVHDASRFPNCLGGGRYCLDDKENLIEILYLHCLLKYDNYGFFFHMASIQNCYSQNCDSLHIVVENDPKFNNYYFQNVQKCVNNSFVGYNQTQNFSFDLSRNDILEEQQQAIVFENIHQYPSVMINNQLLDFSSSMSIDQQVKFVIYKFCKGLFTQTADCIQSINEYENNIVQNKTSNNDNHEHDPNSLNKNATHNHWWIHMIIIGGIISVAALFIFCYRRKMKLYFQSQSDQISTLVQDYYQLSSGKLEKSEEKKDNEQL